MTEDFKHPLEMTMIMRVDNTGIYTILIRYQGASKVAHWQRIFLPMQKTQVWNLGQEYSLEKEMETHSIILAWKITWTKESGGLQSKGLQSQTQLIMYLIAGYYRANNFNIKQYNNYTMYLYILWQLTYN